jgi:hypothetical protein
VLASTLRSPSAVLLFRHSPHAGERKREGDAMIRALAEEFPNDAHVAAQRAQVCVDERGDPLECMRLAARCVELDAAIPWCSKELAQLAEDYTAPYCDGADVKRGFTARLAVPKKPPPPDAVTIEGGRFATGPVFLRSADVARIQTIPPRSGAGRPGLDVSVVPTKKTAIAAALAAEHVYVAFFEGGKFLGAGRKHVVDDQVLEWYVTPALARVCSKIQSRSLPPDLDEAVRKITSSRAP